MALSGDPALQGNQLSYSARPLIIGSHHALQHDACFR
jgi:hypothetical protein